MKLPRLEETLNLLVSSTRKLLKRHSNHLKPQKYSLIVSTIEQFHLFTEYALKIVIDFFMHEIFTMSEITIKCPSCRCDLRLTESLAAPLIETTRKKYEAIIALKESEVLKKEAELITQKDKLDLEKKEIQKEIGRAHV